MSALPSAVQLAKAFGALEIYAVDINKDKLKLAAQYGAIPVNAKNVDAVAEIKKLTNSKGVDVAIEMIGLQQTMKQALQIAGVMGRVVIVGLSNQPLEIDTYNELLGNEVELIGSNDHRLQELPLLVEMARKKVLDISHIVTKTIPLDADRFYFDDAQHKCFDRYNHPETITKRLLHGKFHPHNQNQS